MSLLNLLGLAFALAALALNFRTYTRPVPPPDQAPPTVMHLLTPTGDPHRRLVEIRGGCAWSCDCGSDEWVDARMSCGHVATIHHCHHGAASL